MFYGEQRIGFFSLDRSGRTEQLSLIAFSSEVDILINYHRLSGPG